MLLSHNLRGAKPPFCKLKGGYDPPSSRGSAALGTAAGSSPSDGTTASEEFVVQNPLQAMWEIGIEE